jgi:hypothetical protein
MPVKEVTSVLAASEHTLHIMGAAPEAMNHISKNLG